MTKADRYFFPIAIAVFALVLVAVFFIRHTAHEDVTLSTHPQADQSANQSYENRSKININTAGIEELAILPGIGDAIAARIVSYREEHGYFSSISDLTQVEGIGSERLLQIQEYITVGG